MIHLVFQQSDIEVLQKAIELDESMGGEIIQIRDDFAVGPIENLETEEGWQARLGWWSELIAFSPYPDSLAGSFDDRKTVDEIRQKLDENTEEELWIWMGQNQHDVCGYFWFVSRMKEYQGRLVVLYLNNLPFINEKGNIFYPTTLHEIQPKEFLKAKKLNRKITSGEFEVDPDEWKRLCNENALVRILEGGKKIVGKEEDFYDRDILNGLTRDWQKGHRAVQQILSKMKIKTGDVFLLWRMKQLAANDRIEINGDPSRGWKDFEVKIKSSTSEEAVVTNEQ